MVQLHRHNLEELDEVVEEAEEDDGHDVARAVPHGALAKGEADGDEALGGHGHDAVHAAGEGDVDDGDGVGRQEGEDPHREVLRHHRQRVLHEHRGLHNRSIYSVRCIGMLSVRTQSCAPAIYF